MASTASAQKAAFINGDFIVAYYSDYDAQVKFVNTYTNQVFSSFAYPYGEPALWFAGTQLVAWKDSLVVVGNIQDSRKLQLPVTGSPVPGTLLQLVADGDSASLQQLTDRRIITRIAREPGATIRTAASSGNGRILAVLWQTGTRLLLRCYHTTTGAALPWQETLSAETSQLLLNQDGSLLAYWNGLVTHLRSTANGILHQNLGEQFRCIRFTSKDQLICWQPTQFKVTLFQAAKNGQLKSISTRYYTDGKMIDPARGQVELDWYLPCVSDDLSMTVGFGKKVAGLHKNGGIFLFY